MLPQGSSVRKNASFTKERNMRQFVEMLFKYIFQTHKYSI